MPSPSIIAPSTTWWPIFIGLLVLYVPTYYDLAQGIWNSEENAHGPIVLFIAIFLFWSYRQDILPELDHIKPVKPIQIIQTKNTNSSPIYGWLILAFGLLIYAIGRSQEILIFEVGSQIPTLMGVLLITIGTRAVKKLWFPILFLLFMIPLPSVLVDAATGPLKHSISYITESALYHLGYPIARSGVTLSIGPYQLLVADACSGLHSMFSLTAMGLLYIYLVGHRSWLRIAILIFSILPIAYIANLCRVVALTLITYYFGDETGQGFIHGFAGISLFVAALIFLFTLDWLLNLFFTVDNNEKRQDNKQSAI